MAETKAVARACDPTYRESIVVVLYFNFIRQLIVCSILLELPNLESSFTTNTQLNI